MTPQTSATFRCPLCEREDAYVRLYEHLQTSHRKSAVSRALLESTTDATAENVDWLESGANEVPTP
jgi:bacterioferritin (cytochrome b1)